MDKFLNFIADVLEVPVESISPETAYGSIPEWDSLMQLRLVAEIYSKYDADIPIDEVPEIKTLADFFRYVDAK